MTYLAIDFGGTRLRAGLFDDQLRLLHKRETLTCVADGQDAVIQRIIDVARDVAGVHALTAIGIAAPGPLDVKTGVILHAETLPRWHNVPLAQLIGDALDAPAYVENDANLAALAEHRLGAGKHTNPMIYLTISTGIGGGIIIDGKLFNGWSGLAIEPGHMHFPLPDGTVARLEDIASGTALGRWARKKLAEEQVASALWDTPLEDITGEIVGRHALAGDPVAVSIVRTAAHYLGLGLVNLIHLFSPEAIVIGGSVAKLGALIFDPVQQVIERHVLDPLFVPDNLIRQPHFGEDVCLVGAVVYAQEHTST